MFKKYNSIENSYRSEFLARIQGHDLWDKPYVVQEKAHGSNISFYTEDGITFQACKRSGQLREDESFYNHQFLLERYKDKFVSIWESVVQSKPELTHLSIFGEVIGGNYPHDDVPRSTTAKKVQKGILYCPHNEFYGFDILIDGNHYLDVEWANTLFEDSGLLYAKTLFEGSLDDCLAYPNEFNSLIPGWLGLPDIGENICEGVIIKPKETSYFHNGTRVILKNKNEKWAEKVRFSRVIKIGAPDSEKVVQLKEAILTYVTENRLQNVLSKEGELSPKDIGRILGLFNKDVVEDFLKDYSTAYDSLEKSEQKSIKKSISRHTVRLVKANI
ncbi:MAG: RNA ligase family protein [Saprospiraceae bacterium]|nr:RNA ligase family protein [Saprospiraceae bacterium]